MSAGQLPDMHLAITELIDDSRETVEMARDFFILMRQHPARRPAGGGVP
jgi:hypothetical protein